MQGLINRVLASPKASSYIIGLVGLYLTVWELAHFCQVSGVGAVAAVAALAATLFRPYITSML